MTARSIYLALVLILVSGLTHSLVGVWLFDAFPKLRKYRWRIIATLAVLTFTPSILRLATMWTQSQLLATLFAMGSSELIVVLFSAIPLFVVRLIGAAFGRIVKEEPKEDGVTRRQMIERIGGAAVLGTTGSLIGWGAIRGRHDFIVRELVVRLPGLPRALDGYTLAQISDIHVGVLVGERELGEGLEKLASVKADLVVVTGDIVDFDLRYIPEAARALGGIRARDGVFAILGNHDYYTGARPIADALRKVGVDVLVNDGRLIRAGDGGGFALLGVDDLAGPRYGTAGPRLDRALAMVPEDRAHVLLSHQPSSIDAWVGRVPLQLSGHTHGGQFNPGFRPADFVMRYVAGKYDVGKTTLWVNSGFGVVGPPARIGAPPEVTKIVLVSA